MLSAEIIFLGGGYGVFISGERFSILTSINLSESFTLAEDRVKY